MRTIRNWLDRSVAAQALLAFLLAAGAIRLISPELPVAQWLIRSAFYSAIGLTVVLVRRRQDRSAMGGVPAGEHVRAERKLLRGVVPQEPQEREGMRLLVAHRRRQMGEFGWTFLPLIALITLLPTVLWAVLGAWTAGTLWLVCGIASGAWLIRMRRLNLRRLRYMEDALREDRTPAAHHR
jgi:hypothetical protein